MYFARKAVPCSWSKAPGVENSTTPRPLNTLGTYFAENTCQPATEARYSSKSRPPGLRWRFPLALAVSVFSLCLVAVLELGTFRPMRELEC